MQEEQKNTKPEKYIHRSYRIPREELAAFQALCSRLQLEHSKVLRSCIRNAVCGRLGESDIRKEIQ